MSIESPRDTYKNKPNETDSRNPNSKVRKDSPDEDRRKSTYNYHKDDDRRNSDKYNDRPSRRQEHNTERNKPRYSDSREQRKDTNIDYKDKHIENPTKIEESKLSYSDNYLVNIESDKGGTNLHGSSFKDSQTNLKEDDNKPLDNREENDENTSKVPILSRIKKAKDRSDQPEPDKKYTIDEQDREPAEAEESPQPKRKDLRALINKFKQNSNSNNVQ